MCVWLHKQTQTDTNRLTHLQTEFTVPFVDKVLLHAAAAVDAEILNEVARKDNIVIARKKIGFVVFSIGVL